MPEEAIRETAATGEPPRGLASPEFFFLLQRIDRLDERVNARIDQLDEKLSGEIKTETRRLDEKLDGLKFWAIGTVVAVVVGFAGTIIALLAR